MPGSNGSCSDMGAGVFDEMYSALIVSLSVQSVTLDARYPGIFTMS